ncbi:uncharacterized protein LOC144433804 [Glandiceps talaboti]
MVRRNVKFGIETNRTLRRTASQTNKHNCYLTKQLKVPCNYTTKQREWLVHDVMDWDELGDGGLLPDVHQRYLNDQCYQPAVSQLEYSVNKQKRWLVADVIQNYILFRREREEGNLNGNEDLDVEPQVSLIEHEAHILLAPHAADSIGLFTTNTDVENREPRKHRYFSDEESAKKLGSDNKPEVVYHVYNARPVTSYPTHKQCRKEPRGDTKSLKKSKGQKEKHYYFWNGYHRNDFKGRHAIDYYDDYDEWLDEDWDYQNAEDVLQDDVTSDGGNTTEAIINQCPEPQIETEVKENEGVVSKADATDPELQANVTVTTPITTLQPCHGVFRCHRCGSNKYLYIKREKEGKISILLRCENFEQSSSHRHDTPYQLEGTAIDVVKSGWLYIFAQHQPYSLMVMTEDVLRGNVNQRTVKSLVGETNNADALRELIDILEKHLTFLGISRGGTLENNKEEENNEKDVHIVSPSNSTVLTVNTRTNKVNSSVSTEKGGRDNVLTPCTLEVVGFPAPMKPKSRAKTRIQTSRLVLTSESHISKSSLSLLFKIPSPPPTPRPSGPFLHRRLKTKSVVALIDSADENTKKPSVIRGNTLHLELSRRKEAQRSSMDSTNTDTTHSSSLEVIGNAASLSPLNRRHLPNHSHTSSHHPTSLPTGIFKRTFKVTSLLPPIESHEKSKIRPRPPNDREMKRHTSKKI